MKALFLTILFFAVYVKTDLLIDKILIYKNFDSKGFSTPTASTHFKKLKNENSLKKELNKIEIQKIQSIIKYSKCNKHHQMKLGQNVIFSSFIILNEEHEFLITETVIIDLTKYQNYWIKNKDDSI